MLRFYLLTALPRMPVPRWMRYRQGRQGIFAVVGENVSQLSRMLSAVLSEAGIPNAWLSLRRRPQGFHTYGEPLLQRVPYLVLDAESSALHALWQELYEAGRTEAPFVWDKDANPTLMAIESPGQLPPHLAPSMQKWIPFFLTSVLV
ncbi:MAG: hypothetical protein NZ580_00920 [Bacteroidia bacterium]|nr:hypothetical protein [Bacteroidia bacterium]MDW8235257.1 hypothetical protein [Bacteroidia bacterium]